MDSRNSWTIGVVSEVRSEFHVVVLEWLVVEIRLGANVINARMRSHVHALQVT